MKKRKTSIAIAALTASVFATSAMAMIRPPAGPRPVIEHKTYCLATWGSEGNKSIKLCDESANNERNNRELNSNKCTDNQVALHTSRNASALEGFKVVVKECFPVTDGAPQPAQL